MRSQDTNTDRETLFRSNDMNDPCSNFENISIFQEGGDYAVNTLPFVFETKIRQAEFLDILFESNALGARIRLSYE